MFPPMLIFCHLLMLLPWPFFALSMSIQFDGVRRLSLVPTPPPPCTYSNHNIPRTVPLIHTKCLPLSLSLSLAGNFSVATTEYEELIQLDDLQRLNESLEFKCLLKIHTEQSSQVMYTLLAVVPQTTAYRLTNAIFSGLSNDTICLVGASGLQRIAILPNTLRYDIMLAENVTRNRCLPAMPGGIQRSPLRYLK